MKRQSRLLNITAGTGCVIELNACVQWRTWYRRTGEQRARTKQGSNANWGSMSWREPDEFGRVASCEEVSKEEPTKHSLCGDSCFQAEPDTDKKRSLNASFPWPQSSWGLSRRRSDGLGNLVCEKCQSTSILHRKATMPVVVTPTDVYLSCNSSISHSNKERI